VRGFAGDYGVWYQMSCIGVADFVKCEDEKPQSYLGVDSVSFGDAQAGSCPFYVP